MRLQAKQKKKKKNAEVDKKIRGIAIVETKISNFI
jgi:hypothetical protein